MKVLVLGGNGFIGSHLVDALLKEGHQVRVYDSREELYRPRIEGVDYVFGDFSDGNPPQRNFLESALEDSEMVFHLISTTNPKTSSLGPGFDLTTNVGSTIRLLEICVAKKVKRVIFLSSGGTVYGEPSALPLRENSPTNPKCSYGIGKLTIEKYLHYFKVNHGLDYVILRAANPYGPRQNPLGDQGVIPIFLGKLIQDKEIEIWGDGSNIRDYIYIDDLISGIYKAAFTDTKTSIYNLGGGHGRSLKEIIQTIQGVTGIVPKVRYNSPRPFDVHAIYLDSTKASLELSWGPKVSLEEGISKTWDFVKLVTKEKK